MAYFTNSKRGGATTALTTTAHYCITSLNQRTFFRTSRISGWSSMVPTTPPPITPTLTRTLSTTISAGAPHAGTHFTSAHSSSWPSLDLTSLNSSTNVPALTSHDTASAVAHSHQSQSNFGGAHVADASPDLDATPSWISGEGSSLTTLDRDDNEELQDGEIEPPETVDGSENETSEMLVTHAAISSSLDLQPVESVTLTQEWADDGRVVRDIDVEGSSEEFSDPLDLEGCAANDENNDDDDDNTVSSSAHDFTEERDYLKVDSPSPSVNVDHHDATRQKWTTTMTATTPNDAPPPSLLPSDVHFRLAASPPLHNRSNDTVSVEEEGAGRGALYRPEEKEQVDLKAADTTDDDGQHRVILCTSPHYQSNLPRPPPTSKSSSSSSEQKTTLPCNRVIPSRGDHMSAGGKTYIGCKDTQRTRVSSRPWLNNGSTRLPSEPLPQTNEGEGLERVLAEPVPTAKAAKEDRGDDEGGGGWIHVVGKGQRGSKSRPNHRTTRRKPLTHQHETAAGDRDRAAEEQGNNLIVSGGSKGKWPKRSFEPGCALPVGDLEKKKVDRGQPVALSTVSRVPLFPKALNHQDELAEDAAATRWRGSTDYRGVAVQGITSSTQHRNQCPPPHGAATSRLEVGSIVGQQDRLTGDSSAPSPSVTPPPSQQNLSFAASPRSCADFNSDRQDACLKPAPFRSSHKMQIPKEKRQGGGVDAVSSTGHWREASESFQERKKAPDQHRGPPPSAPGARRSDLKGEQISLGAIHDVAVRGMVPASPTSGVVHSDRATTMPMGEGLATPSASGGSMQMRPPQPPPPDPNWCRALSMSSRQPINGGQPADGGDHHGTTTTRQYPPAVHQGAALMKLATSTSSCRPTVSGLRGETTSMPSSHHPPSSPWTGHHRSWTSAVDTPSYSHTRNHTPILQRTPPPARRTRHDARHEEPVSDDCLGWGGWDDRADATEAAQWPRATPPVLYCPACCSSDAGGSAQQRARSKIRRRRKETNRECTCGARGRSQSPAHLCSNSSSSSGSCSSSSSSRGSSGSDSSSCGGDGSSTSSGNNAVPAPARGGGATATTTAAMTVAWDTPFLRPQAVARGGNVGEGTSSTVQKQTAAAATREGDQALSSSDGADEGSRNSRRGHETTKVLTSPHCTWAEKISASKASWGTDHRVVRTTAVDTPSQPLQQQQQQLPGPPTTKSKVLPVEPTTVKLVDTRENSNNTVRGEPVVACARRGEDASAFKTRTVVEMDPVSCSGERRDHMSTPSDVSVSSSADTTMVEGAVVVFGSDDYDSSGCEGREHHASLPGSDRVVGGREFSWDTTQSVSHGLHFCHEAPILMGGERDPQLRFDRGAEMAAEGSSTFDDTAVVEDHGHHQMSEVVVNRLTLDLERFVRYVDLALYRAEVARQKNMDMLLDIVKACFGDNARLHEYGSTRTHLALPNSDLDCVMVLGKGPGGFGLDRAAMVGRLALIVNELTVTAPWAQDIVFVNTANMPVVKFKGIGGIPVDLTCMGRTHHGLRSQQYICMQLEEEPRLRSLALFFKQLLRDHGLADTLTGGLSSYAAVLIVQNFLECHAIMCGTKCKDTASCSCTTGALLLEFLEYYAGSLGSSGEPLVVADPFNPSMNVAHGMYRMSQLREVFQNAWRAFAGSPQGKDNGLESVLRSMPQLEETHADLCYLHNSTTVTIDRRFC